MMRRLIDAAEFTESLVDQYCEDCSKCNGSCRHDELMKLVDTQPTAYDVDKVVEKLEAYSNADGAERLGTMPVVELADAIKIVKGGGVNG
jgi:hypothetical protein|nr:MAG TPA: IRON-SULFUR CLUSTER REPAIR PROTEIN YTFE, NITRIC OXIDE, IRON-SULFUR CLUSTER.8A [Caudoviricetes sp.]